jgi:serine/threonine-protein kinase
VPHDSNAIANALAAAQQRIGATVDGKYKLTSVIGVGGMGVVYEAKHLFLGRPVALKVLHPRYEDGHEAAKRFLREARTLGKLGHRAIVQVLDGGFLGTTPYLVMERLVGENLAQRIARRKALRLMQGVMMLREVLRGLVAAHAKGVVHCDLKPENVFLVDKSIEPGNVKILDFGVARITKVLDTPDPEYGLRAYGTPEYMAPEQIVGGEIGPRTDLYGSGALAYEAFTGKAPFAPTNDRRSSVFLRIMNEVPPRAVGLREPIPGALCDLIDQLLAKTADARPESAADALKTVEGLGILPPTLANSIPVMRAVKPTTSK